MTSRQCSSLYIDSAQCFKYIPSSFGCSVSPGFCSLKCNKGPLRTSKRVPPSACSTRARWCFVVVVLTDFLCLKFQREYTKHALFLKRMSSKPSPPPHSLKSLTHYFHSIVISQKRNRALSEQTRKRRALKRTLMQAHIHALTYTPIYGLAFLFFFFFLNEHCVPACSLHQLTLPLPFFPFFTLNLLWPAPTRKPFQERTLGTWQNPHRITERSSCCKACTGGRVR